MKKKKTVAVIDAGGRGAVLVHAYSKSPLVGKIIAIPGCDLYSINTNKKIQTYPHLKTTSIPEILEICKKEKVDLVDVCQDNAVEQGLVDKLNEINIPAIGPTRAAGQIEWDKAWSRDFMKKYHLPVPHYHVCHSQKEGVDFLKKQKEGRWFIKASGLAEGKGVLPATSNKEATERIGEMKKFGSSGTTYVIEEWIVGEEFSFFALSDEYTFHVMGSAQDHKRSHNFDEGENTGGIGCSSPPLIVTSSIAKQAKDIIKKTLDGLKKEKRPYKGILYLGGIVVKDKVYVIEFNSRWGDPEAEILLPSFATDLYKISMATVNGKLSKLKIKTDTKSRVVVVGCSRGYPGDYSHVKGKQIFGLEDAQKIPGVTVYGAGVKREGKRNLANGGRLFYIVGEGKNVIEARKKAYEAISLVFIEGNNLHYRTDIGWRDVERLTQKL